MLILPKPWKTFYNLFKGLAFETLPLNVFIIIVYFLKKIVGIKTKILQSIQNINFAQKVMHDVKNKLQFFLSHIISCPSKIMLSMLKKYKVFLYHIIDLRGIPYYIISTNQVL